MCDKWEPEAPCLFRLALEKSGRCNVYESQNSYTSRLLNKIDYGQLG